MLHHLYQSSHIIILVILFNPLKDTYYPELQILDSAHVTECGT